MLQKNTTPPLHVDADDSKWMTLFKRVPNQVSPAASKEEKKSWWNRLLGCEKGADVSCPSSNDSEYKCAAIKKHKSNKFHLWPCCMRCGDVPEKKSLQEQSTSTSLPDMVKVCEIQPVKKKSLRVSFQEDPLSTSPKDPETDCVPKPIKSIIKNVSAEQNRHLNDIIQDDVAPTEKKIRCCWKRCQVAPNPKQSLNSSVGLRGLPENRTSWKMKNKKYNEAIQATPMNATLRLKQYKYLGLPNPAQICYMNASLQSLLTLEDFVEGISCQQPIWSLSPEAALLKSFMNISACHSSSNVEQKINCLYAFKNVVSTSVPEFRDLGQKDAHEFLTSLLDQIRNLKPVQQNLASAIGTTYKCPVEEHFVFKMQNIRMCLSCSKTFTREEEFTNLSLDLLPGCGTVKEMLQNYLKNTQVDFQCECGSNTSLQRSSFITLPRVLVLHLKRFVFFSVFGSIKVRRPVSLSKELFLPPKEDGARYSLVSIINHNGFTTSSGHYISDGVDPAVQDEDQTDRWFSYNDLDVQETSYAAVCNKRQTTAYVLFYRRHEENDL